MWVIPCSNISHPPPKRHIFLFFQNYIFSVVSHVIFNIILMHIIYLGYTLYVRNQRWTKAQKVVKLEYLDPQFSDKWIFAPGGFHIMLCILHCLGRTIEGSGIDDAWQEAEVYSSVTTNQIINGNHYNRVIEAHQITLQVLFDLQMELVRKMGTSLLLIVNSLPMLNP